MTLTTSPKFFNVIANGELTRIEWTQSEEFYRQNAIKQPFGEAAKAIESPIKMTVLFKDGNRQGIRGDKYTGNIIDMVKALHKLSQDYYRKKLVHEIVIFDNRNLLPVNTKQILYWHEQKGTIINFLPIYSGFFDIKAKKVNEKPGSTVSRPAKGPQHVAQLIPGANGI